MLDAIFWKMAHHARWQDLPVGYPSMFPCRRYYRRIFRSGRLLTIYRALYQDFCTRARVDLTALVERDCFEINENKVALQTGVTVTWQMRTALLFMQLAYQNLRHLRRVKEQERRRRLPRFGYFVMDQLGRIRQVSSRPSHVQPPPPEPAFTFTSPDQLITSPGFHK
jgi:transposase